MRKIVANLFITLDGVVESPERWVSFNNEMGESINASAAAADSLLLGAGTYAVFAASWPQRTSSDDPLAEWINGVPKFVVTSSAEPLEWQNSTRLDNAGPAVRELKQRPGKDILVFGSSTLVRSLLLEGLLDELQLFLHPLVRGPGKRLFEGVADQVGLALTGSTRLDNGVLYLTYHPA